MLRPCSIVVVWIGVSAMAAGQPNYTVTDISDWTSAQLSSLPLFDHFTPLAPGGASSSFAPTSHSGDTYVGHYDGYYGDYAARVDTGLQTNLPPLGVYYWSYTTCDTDDCHFHNGRVGYSHLFDVNSAGVAVGDSTLEGAGTSSADFASHAVLSRPGSGELLDLTPTATRAAAVGINDAGVIAGWHRTDGPTQGVRWLPDGGSIVLENLGSSVTPTAINDLGVVVGQVVVPEISYFNPEPFVSIAGSAIEQLPLPPQGGVEFGIASDLNNTGYIVGHCWKAAAPTEQLASLWIQEFDGSWNANDLNELVDGGDFILERGLAVNDQGYLIVQGRLDADTSPAKTFLLTPNSLLSPIQRVSGDFDLSGIVDEVDYAQWKRDFGRAIDPAGTGSDGNGDGIVDIADYTVWRNNLQSAAVPPPASAGAVPEPDSQLLVVLVMSCIAGTRHINHQNRQDVYRAE